jgi:hypothetical protein
MLLRACTLPYHLGTTSKTPSGWYVVFITGFKWGEVQAPLGLPVVHHNDRKLILLASRQLFFTIYNWVTVIVSDFYEITFQDLALPLEVSITS